MPGYSLVPTASLEHPFPEPGQLRLEPGVPRAVYSAIDDETPAKIAMKFKLPSKLVVWSNKVIHRGLLLHSKLQPRSPIVLPITTETAAAAVAVFSMEPIHAAVKLESATQVAGSVQNSTSGVADATSAAEQADDPTAAPLVLPTTASTVQSSTLPGPTQATTAATFETVGTNASVVGETLNSVGDITDFAKDSNAAFASG